MDCEITTAQTWRMRKTSRADSVLATGMTPYPACASKALRRGVDAVSADTDNTAGRIDCSFAELFDRVAREVLFRA